jgi:hypothetical protein
MPGLRATPVDTRQAGVNNRVPLSRPGRGRSRKEGAMANRRLRREFADTQKLVKDAAASLRKAADRAAKVARSTGRDIGKSKEMRDARKQARLALSAMAAAAKVAFDTASKGARSLRETREVKKATSRTRKAARSTVKTTKTATKAAGSRAKRAARSARSRVQERF